MPRIGQGDERFALTRLAGELDAAAQQASAISSRFVRNSSLAAAGKAASTSLCRVMAISLAFSYFDFPEAFKRTRFARCVRLPLEPD